MLAVLLDRHNISAMLTDTIHAAMLPRQGWHVKHAAYTAVGDWRMTVAGRSSTWDTSCGLAGVTSPGQLRHRCQLVEITQLEWQGLLSVPQPPTSHPDASSPTTIASSLPWHTARPGYQYWYCMLRGTWPLVHCWQGGSFVIEAGKMSSSLALHTAPPLWVMIVSYSRRWIISSATTNKLKVCAFVVFFELILVTVPLYLNLGKWKSTILISIC